MLIHTAAGNLGAHTNIVLDHSLRSVLEARFLRLNGVLGVVIKEFAYFDTICPSFTISARRSHTLCSRFLRSTREPWRMAHAITQVRSNSLDDDVLQAEWRENSPVSKLKKMHVNELRRGLVPGPMATSSSGST